MSTVNPNYAAEVQRRIDELERQVQAANSTVGSRGQAARSAIPSLRAQQAELNRQLQSGQITDPTVLERAQERATAKNLGQSRSAPKGSLSSQDTRGGVRPSQAGRDIQEVAAEQDAARKAQLRDQLNQRMYGPPSPEQYAQQSQRLRNVGVRGPAMMIVMSEAFQKKQLRSGLPIASRFRNSIPQTEYAQQREARQEYSQLQQERARSGVVESRLRGSVGVPVSQRFANAYKQKQQASQEYAKQEQRSSTTSQTNQGSYFDTARSNISRTYSRIVAKGKWNDRRLDNYSVPNPNANTQEKAIGTAVRYASFVKGSTLYLGESIVDQGKKFIGSFSGLKTRLSPEITKRGDFPGLKEPTNKYLKATVNYAKAVKGTTLYIGETGAEIRSFAESLAKGISKPFYAGNFPGNENYRPAIDFGQAKYLKFTGGSITSDPDVQLAGTVATLTAASMIPIAKPIVTATGIYFFGKSAKDFAVSPTPKSFSQAVITALPGVELISRPIRRAYQKFGSELVPIESIGNTEVLAGKKTFPSGKSIPEIQGRFKNNAAKFVDPTGQEPFYGYHATRAELGKQFQARAGTSPEKGLFIAPELSTHFLGLEGEAAYASGGIKLIPQLSGPSALRIGFTGLKRLPPEILQRVARDYSLSREYMASKVGSGDAFISVRSEKAYSRKVGGRQVSGLAGSTYEAEAIFPEGTTFLQNRKGTFIQRIKGYRYYTEYKGEVIPLTEYTATKSKPGAFTFRELSKISSQSNSYYRTRGKTTVPLPNSMSKQASSATPSSSYLVLDLSTKLYLSKKSQVPSQLSYYVRDRGTSPVLASSSRQIPPNPSQGGFGGFSSPRDSSPNPSRGSSPIVFGPSSSTTGGTSTTRRLNSSSIRRSVFNQIETSEQRRRFRLQKPKEEVSFGKRSSISEPKQYNPSLYSITGNITAPTKSVRKKKLTGLEYRPILRRK